MFNGVFTALVSPFRKSGELDTEGFRSLLQWQAESGVHGFVPCGTTGENPTLTRDEWRTLVSLSIEVAKSKKLKTIAGCGSNNTSEAIDLISEAYELGADGALVVTPYYNKPNQRGLIAHYQAIAERSQLPIVLYNVPGRTNVSITLETLKELYKIDRIVGIKEASGNHAHWLEISKETDLKKKALLAGDDDAFATVLSLGGTGIISASANVAPKEFVGLYNLFSAGNLKAAFEAQKNLLPLVKAMFIETNPSPAKYALHLTRKTENHLRLPLVPVTSDSEKIIQESLRITGII